jgi:hypothetical protein
VKHTNHTPLFVTTTLPAATEDSLYQSKIYATDQDSALFGDILSYRWKIRPSWLSLDTNTGIISGTARFKSAFDTTVTLIASDQKGGLTEKSFALSVVHVNHAPQILSVTAPVGKEDSLYHGRVLAADQDTIFGDTFKFQLILAPAWLTVDSTTGILSGIPRGRNVGDTLATVQVKDVQGKTASQPFTVTITHTNHAPLFVTTTLPAATEDSLYQSKIYAADQDSALFGDIVSYRWKIRPSWLALDTNTGIISGTSRGKSAFDTTLTIVTSDQKGGLTEKAFALSVVHVNHAPQILSVTAPVGKEDSLYHGRVLAADQDTIFGDTFKFQLTHAPTWLTVDSMTGILSGIPRGRNVGDTLATVQVKDVQGKTAVQPFTVTITHTNHAPVFVTTTLPAAMEDASYAATVTASDQDSSLFGDRVYYRILPVPASWLTVDSLTGQLSGTPSIYNLHDTTVAIAAFDNKGGITQHNYSFQISHVNHAPEIVSIAPSVVQEDSTYRYGVIANDIDTLVGDVFAYSLTRRPSWLSVNAATGIVSGIPRGKNVGDTIATVHVADGKGGIATQTFGITVKHTNHTPLFVTTTLPAATEDSLYQSKIYAADQDSALFGDILSYRWKIRPSWLSLDTNTGIISGTSRGKTAFDTTLTIVTSDQKGGLTEKAFALSVVHVNHPPQILSVTAPVGKEDSLYHGKVFAADQDTIFGDTFKFQLAHAPAWLTIDSMMGTLSGIPRGVNVKDTTITVRVVDNHGGFTTQAAALSVTHTNHAPQFVTTILPAATEDSLYQSKIYAADQDSALFGDILSYRWKIRPSWLSLDTNTGIISGTARFKSAFDTTLTLIASDQKGGLTEKAFALSVVHVNHPPQILSVTAPVGKEDSLYHGKVFAADQDTIFGDTFKFQLTHAPTWLFVDSITGLLSGVPRSKDVGDTVATIHVTDTKGSIALQTFGLTINHTNHPPFFVTSVLPQATEDSLYQTSVYAKDQDSTLFGDIISYRWKIQPRWLSLDTVTGIISGTPKGWSAFDTTFTLIASDQKGGVVEKTFALAVLHLNHPPVFMSTPELTAIEDSMYLYAPVVIDPDVATHGDTVRFLLHSRMNMLTIDSLTGKISGVYSLVSQLRGALANQHASAIALRIANKNLVPALKSADAFTVDAVPMAHLRSRASGKQGTDSVSIIAYDTKGASARQDFVIEIAHVNHAPVFTSAPLTTAVEDSLYSYQAQAQDVDTKLFGDSLTYSLRTAPRWLTIDPRQGVLSGIPRGADAVDTSVTLAVSDNLGATAFQSYRLKIRNVNHAPLIVSVPDTTAKEDSLYLYMLTVKDPDELVGRDTTSVFSITKPSWLAYDSTRRTFSGTPRWNNVGDTIAALSVKDLAGLIVAQRWPIHIAPTFYDPSAFTLIKSVPDTVQIDKGKKLSFAWHASSDRNVEDTLSYVLHFWGNGVDTTMAATRDTVRDVDIMSVLRVSSLYSWSVRVTDGRVFVPAIDTLRFITGKTILAVDNWKTLIPAEFVLHQNYPNPFNPSTTIRYGIPEDSRVTLEVYSIMGQRVATLVNERKAGGYYEITWGSATCASGVYFAILRAQSMLHPEKSFTATKKMVILR